MIPSVPACALQWHHMTLLCVHHIVPRLSRQTARFLCLLCFYFTRRKPPPHIPCLRLLRNRLIITTTAALAALLQAMTAPGYAARWFKSGKGSFLAQASGLADRARPHKERSRLRQEAADDRVRWALALKMQRDRAFWASGPLLHACYVAPIFSEPPHECLRRAPHTPPQS